MRLSSTDIYAFKALAYLGTLDGATLASSDAIASATGVPKPYLVRLLATLSGRGCVTRSSPCLKKSVWLIWSRICGKAWITACVSSICYARRIWRTVTATKC